MQILLQLLVLPLQLFTIIYNHLSICTSRCYILLLFYKTGGCTGRNELGIISKPVVEECAAACDALSNCVSFEYKRSSTTCQLSSTCANFDLTVNNPTSAYGWYLRVNDEQIRSENPTPIACLWLLHYLSGGVPTQPTGSTSSLYYVGYDTGGCVGRNELGITTKAIVEECALPVIPYLIASRLSTSDHPQNVICPRLEMILVRQLMILAMLRGLTATLIMLQLEGMLISGSSSRH